MGHTPHYSDSDKFKSGLAGDTQAVESRDRHSHCALRTGWGDSSAGAEVSAGALQALAADLSGGASPQHFMESINAGNRQLGNRAFLRWVSGLHAGEQGMGTHAVAAQGLQGGDQLQTHQWPLQLMLKKQKNKGESRAEGIAEEVPEITQAASPGPGAQADTKALLTPAEPGETAVPGEKKTKKKKKSRVQVALNALRAEGVEGFESYIETQIGETELLHTLTERINRAQDLDDRKAAALRSVKRRLMMLDPEAGSGLSKVAASGPGEITEKAVAAPIKSGMSRKELDLFGACIMGDAGKVKRLFRFGQVDINMAMESGTPLCFASYSGSTAIVRELLSMPGIDVNLANQDGATALYLAAQNGHIKVVKLLLDARGINVNLTTSKGITPLLIAIEKKHREIVKLLLSVPNIKINTPRDDSVTPLLYAADKGYPEIVELLVNRDADVNLELDDGTTPLCYAANNGSIEMTRLLLQVPGIQVNRKTNEGLTALSIACKRGSRDVVRLLLQQKADPDITNDTGIAPLHIACLYGYKAIAEMLLNAGADKDAEMKVAERYTPYSLARLVGHMGIVSLLRTLRRTRMQPSAMLEDLSPCLPAAEPAPLLTTAGAGSAKAGGQALEGQPGRASRQMTAPETVQAPASRPVAPAVEVISKTTASQDSQVTTGKEPVDTAPVTAVTELQSPVMAGSPVAEMEPKSALAQAKHALIQEVLSKLSDDNLEPLEGIRLLENVNDSAGIDALRSLYNRLAGIERQRERARRHKPAQGRGVAAGAEALPPGSNPPGFALGRKMNLDAEGVEKEIKVHLAQSNHRFISQAVNDMEFGRGKPTAGYPGLLHASAGIAGVGSCSVFFYIDTRLNLVRIVGIGHHLERETYRLDYAVEELARCGRTLSLS